MKIVSKSLNDTETFANNWLNSLTQKEDGATVVGLYGNLGSGKTTFTQAVARIMEVKDIVNSPTFVIEKIYETKHPDFHRLIHIDAYRLEKAAELQTLNFEELVENRNNLIIIEWPENVKEILPPDHIKIHCNFVDETTRQFEVQ